MPHTKFEHIWTNGYGVIGISFGHFWNFIKFVKIFIQLLSKNYCTDTFQTLHCHLRSQEDLFAKFLGQKVKGQGQGHPKVKKHIFAYNFGSSKDRDIKPTPFCSLKKGPSEVCNQF